MGFYSPHLERYLKHFDRQQILPILFEEAVLERSHVRRRLARFLGVSEELFPEVTGRVNPSTVPRFRSLASVTVKAGRQLRRHHLESLVDLAGRLGLRTLLTSGSRVPSLDPQLRRDLSAIYAEEFEELERTWGMDLSSWKDPSPLAPRLDAADNAETRRSQ
jgi:hypothetical protein